MKIAIIGYSGSGKSTLARSLASKYQLPVLHFDTVQFLPNWEVRGDEEKKAITKAFMDTNDRWVIDGNYSKLLYERRMEEADTVILLLFNRFSCLLRAYHRYKKYKNTTRPDMGQGCNEKFDVEFMKWILWKGRTKQARQRYQNVISQYPEKAVVIKTQRQLDRYLLSIGEACSA
ncbi:MAG: DNA topology modulation protein [Oscillospiraceae bacterium]|nr:DNA topology modulation protein [Oscillospiraceae bacterium]MBQ4601080.1 DNA topology modulation protein [Oscillospiraceae bacterium]